MIGFIEAMNYERFGKSSEKSADARACAPRQLAFTPITGREGA
jgi:hypothetical protein